MLSFWEKCTWLRRFPTLWIWRIGEKGSFIHAVEAFDRAINDVITSIIHVIADKKVLIVGSRLEDNCSEMSCEVRKAHSKWDRHTLKGVTTIPPIP